VKANYTRNECFSCAGLMAYATIMWATEAMPLWVTSMSIPLIAVVKVHSKRVRKNYTRN
jgi:hypothetical protein